MLKAIDGSFFSGIESGKANIKDAGLVIKKLSESAKNGVFLQVLNAKAICSGEQFLFAAKQAICAEREGTAFSGRMEMELLLRVTATRQINRAVEIAGIKNGAQDVAIAGISKDKKALEKAFAEMRKEIRFRPAPKILKESSRANRAFLVKAFGITGKELLALESLGDKALESAIIERIALNALNQ